MAQCTAKTRDGTPCQIPARAGQRYCHVHRRQRLWRWILSSSALVVVASGILSFVADVVGLLDFLGINPQPTSTAQAYLTVNPPTEEPTNTLLPQATSSYPSPATTAIPALGTLLFSTTVQVHGDEYWYDTGITVQPGDQLEFTASGSWWNGTVRTGPNGDIRPSCRKCLMPGENLGALIGKITAATDYGTSSMREAGSRITTDSSPFRVGAFATHVADLYGSIMLTMNEEVYSCKDGRVENCYEDNSGVLDVEITVRRVE